MNTLIIVDCQNDFVKESGSLYVQGAYPAIKNIEKLILSETIEEVIFTVDWHPYNHCSFIEENGKWPRHCVKHTYGSNICSDLLYACQTAGIAYQVLEKGSLPTVEEYGAVSEIKDKRLYYELHSKSSKVYLSKRSNIIVCGVAGDYCVLETLKQLKPLSPLKKTILIYIISAIIVLSCSKYYPGIVNKKNKEECILAVTYSLIPILNSIIAVCCIIGIIFNTLVNYLKDDN